MTSKNFNDAAKLVWQDYKEVRKGDSVIRSGFGLYGAYPYVPNEIPFNRPESVSEHTRGMIELIFGINRYFPEIFKTEELVRAIRVAHYHDLGENELGDLPDDGSYDRKTKDFIEYQHVLSCSEAWPDRLEFMTDYVAFQFPESSTLSKEQRLFAENLRLCDKLDAVLKGLFYELRGVKGSMEMRKKRYGVLYEREIRLAKEIGTDEMSDIWAAYFIEAHQHFQNFPLFLKILRAAVVDVRGADFPWLEKKLTSWLSSL